MGLFDDEDYSLMRQPQQYGNPTGRADPSSGLGLAPPQEAPNQRNSPGNILRAVGAVLEGVGAARKGRPNPAIEQFNTERALGQRDKEQKQRAEAQEIEKYKSMWGVVKEVTEANIIDSSDDEKTSQFGKMITTKFGVPDQADLITEALRDKGFRDSVEKVLPALVRQYGLQPTLKMARNPAFRAKLPEMEKLQRGENTFNDVANAFRSGAIPASISAADLEAKFPGALNNLNEEQQHALNQSGLVNIKTKAIAQAEAVGERQDKTIAAAGERQDKSIAAQSERQDRQIAVTMAGQQATNDRFLAMEANRDARETRLQEQNRRVLPSQLKALTGNRQAMKTIDEYGKAYDEFIKESSGQTLSDVFRGAIAKNKNAQRASDLVTAEGRTPAERKLAAQYNALVGNIRNLTDEVGVLTDIDAVRILGSFDPAQDRKQVKANLAERRKIHQRNYETTMEDARATNKDVSKFEQDAKPKGEGPSQSEVEAAKKRLGITK